MQDSYNSAEIFLPQVWPGTRFCVAVEHLVRCTGHVTHKYYVIAVLTNGIP